MLQHALPLLPDWRPWPITDAMRVIVMMREECILCDEAKFEKVGEYLSRCAASIPRTRNSIRARGRVYEILGVWTVDAKTICVTSLASRANLTERLEYSTHTRSTYKEQSYITWMEFGRWMSYTIYVFGATQYSHLGGCPIPDIKGKIIQVKFKFHEKSKQIAKDTNIPHRTIPEFQKNIRRYGTFRSPKILSQRRPQKITPEMEDVRSQTFISSSWKFNN